MNAIKVNGYVEAERVILQGEAEATVVEMSWSRGQTEPNSHIFLSSEEHAKNIFEKHGWFAVNPTESGVICLFAEGFNPDQVVAKLSSL